MRLPEHSIRICDDCLNLRGEQCHEPECVFCRRTMAEVGVYLDALLIRPVVDGVRQCASEPAPLPPLTYLACPYSHPDRAVRVARFEAANRAASVLMLQGHKVFSPISHTHPIAEAGALPLGWEFWAEFDRAYLSHSRLMIVLRIDGWERSTGVQAEIRICAEFGVPVEYMDLPQEAMAAAALGPEAKP